MNTFFISTPIYYVNAKPHLGHGYTTIVADSLSRYNKAMGKDVFFLTGTDEHGDKIVQAAEKNAQSPQAYVDCISGLFKELWPALNIENNAFIRTTEPHHKTTVQTFLQRVYDNGDIYFGEYGGHYCYGCERFYTEKELDEEGLCPQHKTKPEFIQEKNYFFRMAKYQGWLLEHIEKNPDFIRPERYRNEVVSLLQSGALEDLCISRPKSRLDWGIELPFDKDYVCYVWFDALINYVSALGWPEGEAYARYWPNAQHLVAKDILKPHAIFWPTMLKSAGLPVYKHLNVHGYWLVRDTKMSKSLGNVVEPLQLKERYGLDAFRYFLLREMHFGNDASFSEEALVARLNADLANDLGNLFSRVLSMAKKFCKGLVPAPQDTDALDQGVMQLALEASRNYQQLFSHVMFSRALDALWELIRGLNKYVDEAQPWALNKSGNTERLASVMYILLESMRKVAVQLWPVMPHAAGQMLEQLGVPLQDGQIPDMSVEADNWGLLPAGAPLAKASNLFPRVELEPAAEEQKREKPERKPEQQVAEKASPAESAAIAYEDFTKVDLRVGTVLVAEPHPKADKLLRLEIDLGEDAPRQVIGGLREFFSPEELVGRQVVVVANLAPRKLRGLESHGMVLAVRTDGGMQLLTTTGDVANGGKVS